MIFCKLTKSFCIQYLILELEKHGYTADIARRTGHPALKGICKTENYGKHLSPDEKYLSVSEYEFLVKITTEWLNKNNVHGYLTVNKLGKIAF